MSCMDTSLNRGRPSDRDCGSCSICAEHVLAIPNRKILARKQEPNGSSLPGNSLNEAVGVQCEDHLVHGRKTHAKVSLHVGLGRGLAVDLAAVVNEREILTLFVCEGFWGHKESAGVLLCTDLFCRNPFPGVDY